MSKLLLELWQVHSAIGLQHFTRTELPCGSAGAATTAEMDARTAISAVEPFILMILWFSAVR